MKISFWGSSDFSLTILKKLYEKHQEKSLELTYVVSQPAKPFGRKKELKHNVVAEFCLEHEIPLLLPHKISQFFAPDQLEWYFKPEYTPTDLHTDISVVAAYGKIIPERVLNTATYGFINFHGSILPKYRGAIPVQLTVCNQDRIGGITIIKMTKGMDDGEIISAYEVSIEENITGGELMGQLAELSAKMIDVNFDLIFQPKEWQLTPQNHKEATYCYISDFTKDKLEVLPSDSVLQAHGKIMAANPEPKAWAVINGKKYNLIRSYLLNRNETVSTHIEISHELSFTSDPSKIHLYLKLKDGLLEVKEVQPEGKSIMDARSFINGYLK